MRILRHSCRSVQSGVLVSLIFVCAAASFSQDLGEIARQERARRQEHPLPAEHVYTNDDLQRQHILVPEDRARVLAARTAAANPNAQVAQAPASAPAASAASASPAPAVNVAAAPSVSAPLATNSGAPVSHRAAAIVSAAAIAPGSAVVAPSASVTAEPAPTPLQAILRLVREREVSAREAAAEKRSSFAPRSSETGVAGAPDAPNEAARRESESKLVVSRSAKSTTRRHRLVRARAFDPGVPGIVTVQPGDSLWMLARRYLGRGARWRELAALNDQVLNPNVLHVGEWICLPPADLQNAREKVTPRTRAPAPATRNVVQKIAPKICPHEAGRDRFVVTAEPLGAPLPRGPSLSQCTSTP